MVSYCCMTKKTRNAFRCSVEHRGLRHCDTPSSHGKNHGPSVAAQSSAAAGKESPAASSAEKDGGTSFRKYGSSSLRVGMSSSIPICQPMGPYEQTICVARSQRVHHADPRTVPAGSSAEEPNLSLGWSSHCSSDEEVADDPLSASCGQFSSQQP